MAAFEKNPMFPCNPYENVKWRKIDGLEDCLAKGTFCDEPVLKVKPEALERLAQEAFHDISHYLRPGHLEQLCKILEDPDASANDRFVALDLLRNSQIAAEGFYQCVKIPERRLVWQKKAGVYGPGER